MAKIDEETGLVQSTSSPESEAEKTKPNNIVGYPNQKLYVDVVDAKHVQNKALPFCFVKIWPRDADPQSKLEDAVKLFEEMDQRLLQISEKIRDKVFRREDVLYRLRILKKSDLYELNQSIQGKKDSLTRLNTALDYFSFPLSCASEEKLEKHKLNFQIQHKTKNLAQEKHLYREMNVSPKRNNASAPLMAELSDTLWTIPRTYECCYKHYKKKKYEKLVEEIKQFQATRKISEGSTKTMRNLVKVICDDLTDMGKKKRELEMKIEFFEKELESINEEIWSIQEQLMNYKDKHYRDKEASLVILEHHRILEFRWFLRYGNLGHGSIDSSNINGDVINGKTRFLYWARELITSFE